ncbi:MAG: rRNA maturation RNase YbeY, partial [Paracoccaceae bacterium]
QEDGADPNPFDQVADDPSLGDIALSYPTCRAEADAAGLVFSDHILHLLVHSMLHLLGYDHKRDLDATLMEGLEIEILGKLGVNNPYKEITKA